MLSRIKFWQIAAISLLLLNVGIVIFMSTNRPPKHREGPKNRIIEQLKFDPQQVSEYEKYILQHRAAIQAKQQEMHQAKNALYAQLKVTPAPSADSLAQTIGRLQTEIEHIHYQHFQEIKNLCRADQLPAFDELAGELARYFAPAPPPGK